MTDLADVDEATAIRGYDPEFESCIDVDASEDCRPCIYFIVKTRFGLAEMRKTGVEPSPPRAWHLSISQQLISDVYLGKSNSSKVDTELVDASVLPSLQEPIGEDPVTGLPLELWHVGFGLAPWGRAECAACGDPVDTLEYGDGTLRGGEWHHERCDPACWDDSFLAAFADGGERGAE